MYLADGIADALVPGIGLPVALAWWPASTRTDAIDRGVGAADTARFANYGDVRLAWGVRAIMTLSNTLVVTFVNYFVTGSLHLRGPQRFVGLAAGVAALAVLCGAVWAGRASDRSGHRRRYVAAGSVVVAGGEILLGGWQRAAATVLACALVGFGYGTYLTVDQALTVDVLPHAPTYGRDIGILNTSTTAPQVIAPAMAALLLATSSSYAALFVTGAAVTLFTVPLVRAIRSVA